MFTIHNQQSMRHQSFVRPDPTIPARRFLRYAILLCIMLTTITSSASAQCDYRSSGYIFLHPFFRNVNWQSSLFPSFIDNTPLCEAKPVQIAISAAPAQGTAIYTDADGKWYLSNGPLVNSNCVCCKPEIVFEDAFEIAVPESLSLRTTIPFHVLCGSTTRSDTVCLAASSTNKAYCLYIDATSGKIGRIELLPVDLSSEQSITGIWGDPDDRGIDRAIWICGTGGLIVRLPYADDAFDEATAFNIDNSESVQCIGDDYAGTASGKIYRRDGSSFTLDASVGSNPLRSISKRIAVGDAGTVIVRKNDTWQEYKTENANYRYGNLTANASGTMVELLDESWNYSSNTLFNTATSIGGVQPSEAASGLNSGVFIFEDQAITTISLQIHDPDGNRSFPTIRLRGSNSEVIADSTTLMRQNPAAICTTGQYLFDDSIVKLILSPKSIVVEAQAKKAIYTASCPLWKWQQSTFSTDVSWLPEDSLLVTLGNDIMRIYNKTTATGLVAMNNGPRKTGDSPLILTCSQGTIRITPRSPNTLRSIRIITPAGRILWKTTITASLPVTLASPRLVPGIYLVRADHENGTHEISRIAVTGK